MESYDIIRSSRRTLALEVTRDCRVLVRAPQFVSRRQIDEFLAQHQSWLEIHLARQRQRRIDGPPPRTEAEIAALKARAREVLPPRVAIWSAKMGLIPTGVKITAAKSRYGSCNGRNSLCFSCFLLDQPEAAIDLVVVHELCHIREKNHGPRFYALLEATLPDWRARKKLLR